MSKDKAIVVAAPASPADFSRHILHLHRFHQAAMVAANQSVAAAVLTGLELLAVQEELKKSHTATFEVWLSNHEGEIGFHRGTAFRYTKLAHGMKARLADAHLGSLLSLAPSEMSADNQRRLLKALHRSVDGESLNELYLDFGIVKKPRKAPHNPDPANNGAASRKPADASLIIEDHIIRPLAEMANVVEWWSKPVKIGKATVPVWEHASDAEKPVIKKVLELVHHQSGAMLAQLREGRGRK